MRSLFLSKTGKGIPAVKSGLCKSCRHLTVEGTRDAVFLLMHEKIGSGEKFRCCFGTEPLSRLEDLCSPLDRIILQLLNIRGSGKGSTEEK